MRLFLFSFLLFPFQSFASWTDAELQANLQVPNPGAYLSCYKDTAGRYGLGNAYTTNANYGTAAGTDNIRFGFSPTTNIYTNSIGYRESRGNAAVTFTKAMTINYTYNGQAKVASIPAGTYWGNPTSSWRISTGQATAWIPSTGIANSLRLTGFSVYSSPDGGPMFYDIGYLKVTVTLPNGSPAHFYLDCYS